MYAVLAVQLASSLLHRAVQGLGTLHMNFSFVHVLSFGLIHMVTLSFLRLNEESLDLLEKNNAASQAHLKIPGFCLNKSTTTL
ncbi:hypothetical protein YWY31_02940 [Paenibacillus illinoisensis]